MIFPPAIISLKPAGFIPTCRGLVPVKRRPVMIMSVVTFLKKDELAFKIYKAIWENRNIRIVPKNPHFFNRFCIVKPDTEVFIYSGRLYIVCGYNVVINHPAEQPKFSEEEIKSTIKTEVVEFERKKGEGKFLTKDNLEKRFELLETNKMCFRGN